jgi:uncharacterized protein
LETQTACIPDKLRESKTSVFGRIEMASTDSLSSNSYGVTPVGAAGQPVPIWKKAFAVLLMFAAYQLSQVFAMVLRPTARVLPASLLASHSWIQAYDHHLMQLLFALALIAILSRGRFTEFGLNLSNAAASWRILWKFCLVYSVAVFFVNVAHPLFTHTPPTFDYPLTRANVIGWLSFEGLFVGVSEEILFRGLMQTYLARTWRGVVHIKRLAVPTAGIVTTILFCLAHINLLHPHPSWAQQVWAFGLGIYYSTVYYRTKSLLNPILAHNFSDGIIFAALYLLYWGLH